MTAEEKLRELKDLHFKLYGEGENYIQRDNIGRVFLTPSDIDLIANLVVERLKNDTTKQ